MNRKHTSKPTANSHHLSNGEAKDENAVYDRVDMTKLPAFADLNEKVTEIVDRCSWWDLHGVDWMIIIVGIVGACLSYELMRGDSILSLVSGMVLLGCCHSTLANKGGHCASHGSLAPSPALNRYLTTFFVEFIGSFSSDAAIDIHIKCHHPHTNIIGLGDSSTWRMPMIPAYIYMFVTPLLVPLITPVVAFYTLLGQWTKLARCIFVVWLGLSINLYLMMHISGFSMMGAILCTFVSRATLAIPYIHVNIFQHIGLPMYSQKARPKRIYQMATGVLNLYRNPVLDLCFGHGIMNCHVEHHLFPRLSDNVCLKIKPVVSDFLKKHGLPYHEESYRNRLSLFLDKYEELMVNAPPITHFVGLQ